MKPPLNRRAFLKTSLGTAAGTAGSSLSALATPSSKTRIGVVGTGGRGSDLIRKLTTLQTCEVVAICDDYQPHLSKGSEYAGPQALPFSSFEEMLERTGMDAVVIATPLHLHHPMALQAIEKDLHVYCEKMMCLTLDQAIEVSDAVDKAGVNFRIGLQRQANPVVRQAQAMIETGMLGEITTIKCQWHRNNDWRRPVPVERNHPEWEELDRRLNWRMYRDYSRGLLAELGSHQMQLANDFLGTVPARVRATGGIDHWRDGREVFDNIFCTYEYEFSAGEGESPRTVRVTYSALQTNAFEGASELIMGTQGTLFLTQNKGLFYRENVGEEVEWAAGADGGTTNAAIVTSGKTLGLSNDPWAHRGKPMEIDTDADDTRESLRLFLEGIRKGETDPRCDARAGLVNTATMLMADEAARSGRTVDFPADLQTR